MEVSNLKAYLANLGMTVEEFAKKLDCDRNYLSVVMRGKVYPSRRFAKDIKEATGGLIDLPTNPNLKKNRKRKNSDECVDNVS